MGDSLEVRVVVKDGESYRNGEENACDIHRKYTPPSRLSRTTVLSKQGSNRTIDLAISKTYEISTFFISSFYQFQLLSSIGLPSPASVVSSFCHLHTLTSNRIPVYQLCKASNIQPSVQRNMAPHQSLTRIAPLLGPEFQNLISMLVLEKLEEAYMILFEKEQVTYLPWLHHFQRLVDYYLMHHLRRYVSPA